MDGGVELLSDAGGQAPELALLATGVRVFPHLQ